MVTRADGMGGGARQAGVLGPSRPYSLTGARASRSPKRSRQNDPRGCRHCSVHQRVEPLLDELGLPRFGRRWFNNRRAKTRRRDWQDSCKRGQVESRAAARNDPLRACQQKLDTVNSTMRREGKPEMDATSEQLLLTGIRQGWKCAIEGCDWPGRKNPTNGLSPDHDHDTGLFREWLCPGHNFMEGDLKRYGRDRIVEVTSIIVYMDRWGAW